MSEPAITMRPVRDCDEDFLIAVYASSREQELAQVPWTPAQKEAFVRMQWEAQKRHYRLEHPKAEHLLISRGEIPVGRLYIDRTGEEIHILDITVLAQNRRRGVGSAVMGQIRNEANASAKPVTIFVESYNPSLEWFNRLGFSIAQEKGFHLLLKWPPAA